MRSVKGHSLKAFTELAAEPNNVLAVALWDLILPDQRWELGPMYCGVLALDPGKSQFYSYGNANVCLLVLNIARTNK